MWENFGLVFVAVSSCHVVGACGSVGYLWRCVVILSGASSTSCGHTSARAWHLGAAPSLYVRSILVAAIRGRRCPEGLELETSNRRVDIYQDFTPTWACAARAWCSDDPHVSPTEKAVEFSVLNRHVSRGASRPGNPTTRLGSSPARPASNTPPVPPQRIITTPLPLSP